jgi:heme A synthase
MLRRRNFPPTQLLPGIGRWLLSLLCGLLGIALYKWVAGEPVMMLQRLQGFGLLLAIIILTGAPLPLIDKAAARLRTPAQQQWARIGIALLVIPPLWFGALWTLRALQHS